MNTEITNEYMLLFRGPEWDHGLAPQELRQVMDRVMAWFDGLQQQGRVKAGQPLAPEGRVVAAKKGRGAFDGPYVESKEGIGGYLLLHANDLDEAVAIARSCPTLEYNITVEVRPVLAECPVFKRAQETLALATA